MAVVPAIINLHIGFAWTGAGAYLHKRRQTRGHRGARRTNEAR
jgi:hypothetical protein